MDRPAITVRTGTLRPTRRAVRANLGGFATDSRYSRASLVAGSDSHHSSMSSPATSSLSPSETREEIPTPIRDRCSTKAKPAPPVDCSARPAHPGLGWRAANVASRPALVSATPKLAGPTIRMPWRRQMPSNSVRPAPLSPAASTTSALTPRCPHSSAIPTTAAAGVAMTARSTSPGSAAADGTQGTPSSSVTAGLTAYTGPEKPPVTMLCRMARPTEPGRGLAPMTATEAGASTCRRLATSADRSRSATASR